MQTHTFLEFGFMIKPTGEPKGANALEAYKEVLLNPNNQTAWEGLEEIASHYEPQAREQWQKGKNESSAGMLKKGLQASPQHKGLNK